MFFPPLMILNTGFLSIYIIVNLIKKNEQVFRVQEGPVPSPDRISAPGFPPSI